MAHYQRGDRIVGWGPAVHEIDYLAGLFDEVRHIGCLHSETAPGSALPYSASNVHLVAVPPAGGTRLADKMRILRLFPLYARTILKEVPSADAIHVRAPANICLLALLLLSLRRTPRTRWFKYAGNWTAFEGEAWSYKVQRWWLHKGWAGGQVTVNGAWPDQPRHVHSFLNPCLTEEEIEAARDVVADKHLTTPLRLLFVGALTKDKGIYRALDILASLSRAHHAATLDVVGDGEEQEHLEAYAESLGVQEQITLHGWVPRTQLEPHYRAAQIMIFPSKTEGWPKVLSEAMAYGVVPVASHVGSIPQYLERFDVGRTFPPTDIQSFKDAVSQYIAHPERWKRESDNAVQAAHLFSYSTYLHAVQGLLALHHEHAKPDAEPPPVPWSRGGADTR